MPLTLSGQKHQQVERGKASREQDQSTADDQQPAWPSRCHHFRRDRAGHDERNRCGQMKGNAHQDQDDRVQEQGQTPPSRYRRQPLVLPKH